MSLSRSLPGADVKLVKVKDYLAIAQQEAANPESAPYLARTKRINEEIANLPNVIVEEVYYEVPLQSEIRLTGKAARNTMVEITDPVLSKKSGPESRGTLFDYRMGTITKGLECGTCKSRECKVGHNGYILFPNKGTIPYVSYIEIIIDILSCFCLVCRKPLLSKSAFQDLQLKDGMTRKDRLVIIKARSLAQKSCLNILPGGRCNQNFKFDKKKSKDRGFISYERDKLPNSMSGRQIDKFFRHVFADPDILKFFGYDDVEEICAYVCVGVIVPAIKDRPFMEGFDKINNPINEKLSRIVSANNNLKDAIAKKEERRKYAAGMGGETRILPAEEIARQAATVSLQMQANQNILQRTILEYEEQIFESKKHLEQYTSNAVIARDSARTERLKYEKIAEESTNINDRSNAIYMVGKLDGDILSYDNFIENDPHCIDVKSKITSLEEYLKILKHSKNEEIELYAAEIKRKKESQEASKILLASEKGESDITNLIVALYEAHREYVELVHKNVSMGKGGLFRKEGLGKNAHYVARTVASPGVDINIDEIEIPEILAGHLTIIEEVTDENIIKLQKMLRLDVRKITHVFSSEGPIDISDDNIQRRKIVLKRGDTVTRHLQDGDIVVAVRMPSLHTGNMKAFKARVIKNSLTIRVHMVWTTSYNLDFDGDEMSLYVVQGQEAINEAMRTMYAPLSIIAPRSGTPIGGVVYNAVSAWYLVTGSSEIISQQTWDTVLLKLTGREQLTSVYRRLYEKGVVQRTGRALFSMLLPEDFNYPASNQNPIDGVIIRSGIMISGTITSKHIGSGKADSIIAALHHRYGVEVTTNFLNDIYMSAYLLQKEFPQTITPEDCAFGEYLIAKFGSLKKFDTVRAEIEKEVKGQYYTREFYATEEIQPVEFYEEIVKRKFPKLADDSHLYAENYIIQRRIEKMGIFSKEAGGYDYVMKKYTEITHNEQAARILVNNSITDRVLHRKTGTYMRGHEPRVLIRSEITYNADEIKRALVEQVDDRGNPLNLWISEKPFFSLNQEYRMPTPNAIYGAVGSVYRYKTKKIIDYYTMLIGRDRTKVDEFNAKFNVKADIGNMVTSKNIKRALEDAMPPFKITRDDAQAIANDIAYKAFLEMGLDYDDIVNRIIYSIGELPIAPGGEEAARIAYAKVLREVKGISQEEAEELAKGIRIGKSSEIEGMMKLQLAEKKIRNLGPVPTDKLLRKGYEISLMEIISSMSNVGADAAVETRRFIQNNLMDMSSYGAGAKGSEANISMMGGHVGQQQIKGQFRLNPTITGNTRCTTNFRPGDTSLAAYGYVSSSYSKGLNPIESFFGSMGSREGISDTATKTSASGLFNKRACKSMENLVTSDGAVINQSGDVYQYLYGDDGFSADKLVKIKGRATFIDLVAFADRINYEGGWELI